jgi:hypothetical protein
MCRGSHPRAVVRHNSPPAHVGLAAMPRSSATLRAAKAVATPGSRRAGSDSARRNGNKSPSSGTAGDLITAKPSAFPQRDLADSLSVFAAIDFSAEKNMLENVRLTPPTRAMQGKGSKTPVSAGRRALGDVANLTERPLEKSPDHAVRDCSAATGGPSVYPPPAVTTHAPLVVPKSPAETLAAKAKDAASGLRRSSIFSPAVDSPARSSSATADVTGAVMLTPVTHARIANNDIAVVSSRKKRSAERARVMATHAARVMDTPSEKSVETNDDTDAAGKHHDSPVDRVMLHYTEGKASDELLDALEIELRNASAASGSVGFLDDDDDDGVVVKRKPADADAPTNAATPRRETLFDWTNPTETASPELGGSPFIRLVAVDCVDDDEPVDTEEGGDSQRENRENNSGGNASGGEVSGSGSGDSGFGNFGAGGFGSDDLFTGDGDGDGDDSGKNNNLNSNPKASDTSVVKTLPSHAGVTLANALGKWREAVAVASIEVEAKKVQSELAEILREQAADCDEEVNRLTDENDVLTAALAATTSVSVRSRWRLAAKAGVLTKRCEERAAEARRLRVKARRLEQQLLKVEEHITSAAHDFDRLRVRLTESGKETERARGGERDARVRLAEAQAQTAEALSRTEKAFRLKNAENVSPLGTNRSRSELINTTERERKNAKTKILAELRTEMREEVREEFGEMLRKEAELEAFAEAKETARRVAEASSASKTVAATIDALLRNAQSKQMRQVATARREATVRARENLREAVEHGVDTLRLGHDSKQGGVDPLELVSLIAVHALERCEGTYCISQIPTPFAHTILTLSFIYISASSRRRRSGLLPSRAQSRTRGQGVPAGVPVEHG